MTKEQPSPVYSEDGTSTPIPIHQENGAEGSRLWMQIKALMKKDFQVMQAHRRALISELVFPLLMGTLACLFLSVFLNQSGWSQSGGYSGNTCSGNYYGAMAPFNFPNGELFNATVYSSYPPEQIMQYCGAAYNPSVLVNNSMWVRTMHAFDDAESMLEGYRTYVGQLNPPATNPTDYRLGALMYYKNYSDPYEAISIYQTQQVAAYETIPLGTAAATLWNGFPNVTTTVKHSSNPQTFNIRQVFATSGAIMLAMSFLPMTSTMAGRLVDEKKAKVREHLRVMGVSSTAYLLAAFFVAMIRVGFVSLSMLILIGSFNIVPVGSLLEIWLALVCYGFSLAGFAQIMPAFFSRPTVSNAAVSLFIALTGIGAVFASQITELTPLLAFFFSPSAFIYAAAQLLNNNLAQLKVTPWGAIGCLVWQMFLYSAVSQYLYTINPGEFGVPRPLLFPLHDIMSLITGDSKQRKSGASKRKTETSPLLTPAASSDRIVIENLVKVFGNEVDRPAVNKLSLRIREREIFALLGHNGAGKTTTISMLIGMLTSTSYDTAEVLGYDLNEDLDAIRQHIGICPQFDVLFDDLSARQHLDLYAAVKGRPLVDGDAVLRRLKLPLDDQKSSTFSGGMKRRLSVGNALVGDSPIIFLDEPSSGLDPVSRRQLWELLREEKNQRGKTIVLTTHFMEEADYLGDRIAIMSHGRLYCCDTSANLKNTYGVGYYLNLAKTTVTTGGSHQSSGPVAREDGGGHHGGATFDKTLACEILNRHTSGWSLKQESVGDVTFLLPPTALPVFGQLLQEIEERLDQLGCSSYGVAMNTLEDVFVNISEREAASAAAAAGRNVVDTLQLNTETTKSGVPLETLFHEAANVDIVSKLFFQTWAVFLKKLMAFTRSARLILSCIVIPVIMVGIGFGAAIPNFQNSHYNNNNYNNYNWQDQYSGAVWPNDAHPHIVVYQKSDMWSNALNEVLDTFAAKYVAAEVAIGRVSPTIDLQKVTASEFSVGAFLGGGSISFLTTFNPLMQIGFHDDMIQELVSPTQPNATYTLYYNSLNYEALYLVQFQALLQASIEEVWRRHNNDPRPILLPVVKPITVPIPALNTTSTPAPTTTTAAPRPHGSSSSSSGSDDHQPEFLLIPLGALINICIGQFAAGIILPIADELNRNIYHTLRLHGLSAMAYWAGTFIFDMTTGGSIIAAYIIGAYARGVEQIQNDLMVHQCIVILFTLSFAVMLAYSLALVLPSNLKPSTYMYAIVGVYYLTLVIPLIIYVSILSTSSYSTLAPEWLNFMTPARCLLFAIMNSPYPASSVWGESSTISTYISLVVWNGAVAAVILYKMYFSSRLTLRSSPTDAVPVRGGPSSPVSPATGVPMEQYVVPMNVSGGAVGMLVADPDVDAEERRVLTGAPTDNMAATIHLRKVYHGVATVGSANREQSAIASLFGAKADKIAVNDLTLGIRSGECFGLLGPNGAGKTTTVKMMMRETQPSDGYVVFPYAPDASDVNAGLFGNIDGAYQTARLGVCQQGDTLWENFSAEEHMRLYLRVRLCGQYSGSELDEYIANAIQKVALEEAGSKHAGAFSGGMKRKLAVCVAMYTGARTVFLDEPSTGMDPYARRALWRSINEALQHDRCVLLTTHSMEEADAVCARIGIVTNGVLQCIGNSQHLKNRFGSGYSIVVTLYPRDANGAPVLTSPAQDADAAAAQQLMIESPAAIDATERAGRAVDAAITESFGKYQCELKEVLGLQRRYSIGRLPALSFAFRALQEHQASLGLSNYSVSQLSSLEQIFINFAGSANNEGN